MLHPVTCNNIVELQCADGGAGMPLHLCRLLLNEFACIVINPNGFDGCHVAFVASKHAAGENKRGFAS